MPLDRRHAFSSGTTYSTDFVEKQNLFFRIIRLISARGTQLVDNYKAWNALESFKNSATIHQSCRFGPNSWCINRGSRNSIYLGEGTICRGVLRCDAFENRNPKLVVGDEVYIGDDCLISCVHNIEICDLTLLAHGVQIFDNDTHPVRADLRERDWKIITGKLSGPRSDIGSAPVKIGKRVWIGFNSMVMKGVTIGEDSIIAACSVVVHDIPSGVLAAGNPAKQIRRL